MRKFKRVNWYEDWFDSSYYDLLYGNRDEQEASTFIEHLTTKLKIPAYTSILDLACGKGRHAMQLATKDFQVVGIDLSSSSIKFAKQFEQGNTLKFHQHDMRDEFTFGKFDYILNCFTSFGYFETKIEHEQTLKNVHDALNENGIFILDFLNAKLVKQQLPMEEIISRAGISFNIKKQQQRESVVKSIDFYDKGSRHHFEESVQLFDLVTFKALFKVAKLKIVATYGDYHLNPFQEDSSPRLILLAKKM